MPKHPDSCLCIPCVRRWSLQQARRAERERQRERREAERRERRWQPRGSQPPDVGVIAGTDDLVSFKTGTDGNDGHTLISDGDYSDDADGFDEHHNHYGQRREGPGHFDKDRGYYTGPDH